jgi:hypothetical protein
MNVRSLFLFFIKYDNQDAPTNGIAKRRAGEQMLDCILLICLVQGSIEVLLFHAHQ